MSGGAAPGGEFVSSETNSASLVAMALATAATGLPVFPCKDDKKPVVAKGFYAASTDPAVIRAAFENPRAKLIGVPTGGNTGFDVLDLDPRHGSDTWRHRNIDRLPETRIHRTGRGGEHWLFQHYEGVRNIQDGKAIAPGVDVRGQSGYVIWAGPGYSIISDAEVAPWPAWLLELVLRKQELKPERPAFAPKQRTEQLDKRYQGYARKLLGSISAAPDGAKHDTLLRMARALGGIIGIAGIGEEDAHAWLLAALPDTVRSWNDAAKTATAGLRHGMASPIHELPDRPRPNGANGQHYAPSKQERPTVDPPEEGDPPPPDSEEPAQDIGDAPPETPELKDPINSVIERFNAKFMMVNENGKAIIYQPGYEPVLKRRRFDRLTTSDLMTLYMNEKVMVGVDGKKKPIYKYVADVWLRSPEAPPVYWRDGI